jgi:hypothetical protein
MFVSVNKPSLVNSKQVFVMVKFLLAASTKFAPGVAIPPITGELPPPLFTPDKMY